MVQRSFEEAAAFGLGGGELRFQPVAQGHQFLHHGNDALLLREGRIPFSLREITPPPRERERNVEC